MAAPQPPLIPALALDWRLPTVFPQTWGVRSSSSAGEERHGTLRLAASRVRGGTCDSEAGSQLRGGTWDSEAGSQARGGTWDSEAGSQLRGG
eukprot:350354-Chlamydomonas_euryale.AAC.6